jgi:hypothetical protein
MALETPTFISDLVVTNPAHSDGLNQTDAHLRAIKQTLRNTFPNINGAVNPSDEDLNLLLNAAASGLLAALVDGTSSAPGLTFKSESTLGLYRSAAKTLQIAGGALRGNGAVRPGSIHMFVVEPTGLLGKGGTGTGWEYLELDGSTYNIADFPALALALGVTTGTQFALPKLTDTGRFPRSRTSTLAVGTSQANTVGPHTHPDFAGTTGSENAAHTHGFSGTTQAMDRSSVHSHSETGFQGSYPGYGTGQGVGGGGSFGFATQTNTGAVNIDHLHAFSGTTQQEAQSHGHPFTAVTPANTGTTETRPEAFSFIFAIKT